MNLFSLISSLALVHGLSLVSPGPDFLLVLRSSLIHSRAEGRLAAFGIVLGNAVFISIAAIGFTFLNEASSSNVLTVLKSVGALYLIYIGVRSLSNRGSNTGFDYESGIQRPLAKTKLEAFWLGLGSAVLNGKAAAYFFAIVPQFINADRPLPVNGILYGEFLFLSCLWFFGVAHFGSYPKVRDGLILHFDRINRVVSSLFILFGIILIFETIRGLA